MRPRSESDEAYILGLVRQIVGQDHLARHTFPELLGDPGKDGRRRRLPVDGYFPSLKLIVEYQERQHFEPVPLMDRRSTISGAPRGQQRRIYDHRREQWAARKGIPLLVLTYHEFDNKRGRLLRRKERALNVIRRRVAQLARAHPSLRSALRAMQRCTR